MRWILYAAVADPTLTGIFTFASPSLFGQLILGSADFSPAALALGRIGGAAMFALGLASFPSGPTIAMPATSATGTLLIYNVLATLYLGYLGGIAQMEGVLLWPAVAVHAALAIMLALRWLVRSRLTFPSLEDVAPTKCLRCKRARPSAWPSLQCPATPRMKAPLHSSRPLLALMLRMLSSGPGTKLPTSAVQQF
jgi:hypothetical protein